MENVSDRIFLLLKERHMQAKELASQLDLSPASISDWKSGKSKPSLDSITKISAIFSVSTDYLLLGKESTAELDPGQRDMLEIWDQLDDAGRTIVKAKAIEELRRLGK